MSVCLRFRNASDSGGNHHSGERGDGSVDQNSVLELHESLVFTSGEQHAVAAGVSPSSVTASFRCVCVCCLCCVCVCSSQVRLVASDENSVCADHSGNGGSLLSTYDQLETCIDWLLGWLVDTNVIDETMLAASNLTSKTAASGGDSTDTISIRSLFTGAIDFLANLGPQDILVTCANGSQTATTGF